MGECRNVNVLNTTTKRINEKFCSGEKRKKTHRTEFSTKTHWIVCISCRYACISIYVFVSGGGWMCVRRVRRLCQSIVALLLPPLLLLLLRRCCCNCVVLCAVVQHNSSSFHNQKLIPYDISVIFFLFIWFVIFFCTNFLVALQRFVYIVTFMIQMKI